MSDRNDWRYVYASVPGVSHRASGVECQDAGAAQLWPTPDGDWVLALAAADGAGSASAARTGAELTCRVFLDECAAWLAQATDADWTRATAELLLQRVQTVLQQQAASENLPVREFACTLLGAVLTADRALFMQIGDGAIVIGDGDSYQTVFWPQAGEYANETWFITDSNAAARLEFAMLTEPILEIAVITDGLQPLALHYQSRQAHTPFFRPLFQRLRTAPEPGCPADLMDALERFLDTPHLNQRTHDDKTLILASRLPTAAMIAAAAKTAEPDLRDAAAGSSADSSALREGHNDEAV